MVVSIYFISICEVGPNFPPQVLSTGPPIPVLVDQLIGQQTRGLGLVAGVLTLRTLSGNFLMKLLCEHVVPLCFIHYLIPPLAVRVQIYM